jgi:hypothetical protein
MGAEMKTVGYIILIEAKATQDKTSEAMSYGYPNETDSEMLLRRGRATLFESYEETEQALKKTLLAATAQNSKWPEKFIYKIVPVEASSQRKWVGLTDEEKHDCYLRIDVWSRCVEMVENKLREKNG